MKNLKKSLCLLVLFTLTVSCSSGNSSSKKTDANENKTNADVTLSSLEISSATLDGLSPEFDSSVTEYEVQQNFLADNFFSFTATTTDSEASLIVNEELATSGEETSIALDSSNYTASLYVVAPDASDSQEYTINVTRNPLQQTTYVKASNTETAQDYFGEAVAISGDTMVVGAFNEDGLDDGSQDQSGAAYVYTRNASGDWKFSAKLKASNIDANDQFGKSVAIDGDTIVVGAWNEDGSATTVNGTDDDLLGNSGAAYVFERSASGTWSQTAYLKGSQLVNSSHFGNAVAISNDTIVVGAYNNTPAAYVFIRTSSSWEEEAFLQPDTIESTDYFGYSVAIDKDTVVVGAMSENGGAIEVNGIDSNDSANYDDAGAAYIFERTGTSWDQTAYLKASNTTQQVFFGISVAVSADTVVVGSHGENSDANTINGNQYNQTAAAAGAAYVYVKDDDHWIFDSYLKAPNSDVGDFFGWSVAIDKDNIVVSAIIESSSSQEINGDQIDNSSASSGAAYIFHRNSSAIWEHTTYLKSNNSDSSDLFGYAVAIDGDTAVVSASREDGSGTKINPADDDTILDAGAVYIFQ